MLAFDPEPKDTSEYMTNPPFLEKGECFIRSCTESIIIVDNFLTKESCLSLREWIDNDQNKETVYTRWSENADKKKICRRWNFPVDIIEFLPKDSYVNSYVNPCWRFVKNFPESSLPFHFDGKYIKSVDCISNYTVMVYLSDHPNDGDGQLEIKNGKVTYFVEPKEGRLVIFRQDLLHRAQATSVVKYFIRSEVMFKRTNPIETNNDREAIELFREANLCHYTDPERSSHLEKQAYKLSPLLEDIVFG